MITVTPEAVNRLRELLEERGASTETEGLRLGVSKGGCAGMQYTMQVGAGEPTDHVVEAEGVRLFIDAESTSYLSGCEVDFEDALAYTGFRINNPNAVRSCGCGTSFEQKAS